MTRLFRRAGLSTSGNDSSTGGGVRVCTQVSKLIMGSLDGGGGIRTVDRAAILVELKAGKQLGHRVAEDDNKKNGEWGSKLSHPLED